jgi:hypothetical protein
MKRRACTAVSELGDYDNTAGTCSDNPVVTWEIWDVNNGTKKPDHVINPASEECAGRTGLVDPCVVHVTVTYTFHPIVPLPPVPDSLTIKREAWFAVSDLVDTP